MRIHDSKYDCGKKPKRKRQDNGKNKFRWSRKWTEKREKIKERDNYLCLLCKMEGRYNHEDLEVHHITPLEENFNRRIDEDNLITLCKKHHGEAERGRFTKDYLYNILQELYEYDY